MKKQYKFILILCFVVGVGVSFVLGRQSVDVQSPTFQDVPKNKLTINHDFFKVEPMTYSSLNGEDFFHTTISLTDKGKKYMSTDFYAIEYDVHISLISNTTNDVYLSYSNLKWSTNEKSFDFLIKRNDMTSDKLRKEFNLQLERMKKNEDNNLMYRVEVSSQFNPDNVMETIGVVQAQ